MAAPRPTVTLIAPEPGGSEAIAAAIGSLGFEVRHRRPELDADSLVAIDHAALLADVACGADTLAALCEAWPRTIAVGAREAPADLLLALRAGAADYLPRDALPGEIQEALDRARGQATSHAALEVPGPRGEVRRFPLRAPSVSLGRDPTNDICLDSAVVSRLHARVERRGAAHYLVDSGSRHGTYLDGKRVAEAPLQDGQQIRLGSPGAPVVSFRAAPAAPEPPTRSQPLPGGEPPPPSQEMRDIASLFETFLKLNGDLVLEDLLQIVVARSIELADAERGMILLVEGGSALLPAQTTSLTAAEAGAALRLAVARHRDGTPLEAGGLSISHKIPQEVLRTGKGAILEDLLTPDRAEVHSSTIQIGVRSAMCVPLRPRRVAAEPGEAPRVLGVLYVDSTTRSRPFPERLLHALESLATEAAQAIFSSRLYQESLQKREMDAEMRIAQSIQKSLLPPGRFENRSLELHGSYRASHEVGGDLLDYYPFADGRLTVVIGDVAGKGVSAALVSGVLDGLCYGLSSRRPAGGGSAAVAAAEQDLGQAARDLNRFLASKPGLERFASLVLGTFWPDGRFTHVNAGHNPPLLLRSSGELVPLPGGGTILGVLDDAEYRQEEIRLEPGDLLVLYSDGVTDACSPARERFGLTRLRGAILGASRESATAVHDSIAGAVQAFVAGEPPPDDITLMVVRRKPAPA